MSTELVHVPVPGADAWVTVGLFVWFASAVVVGVVLGRVAARADRIERARACHPCQGFDEHVAEALALIDFDRWERECGGRK